MLVWRARAEARGCAWSLPFPELPPVESDGENLDAGEGISGSRSRECRVFGEASGKCVPRGDEPVAEVFDFGGKRELAEMGGRGETPRDLSVLAVKGVRSVGAGELRREEAADEMEESLSRTLRFRSARLLTRSIPPPELVVERAPALVERPKIKLPPDDVDAVGPDNLAV